jgi:hypothetical protein
MEGAGRMRWPRLRDLPESERTAFEEWLRGQTVPIDPSLPDTPEEQDCYYMHDYERWKGLRRTGWNVWD